MRQEQTEPRMTIRDNPATRRGGIPRGIARSGPAILSYGFRPFFLGAGIFAVLAMVLWTGALTRGWPVGGETYGALHWHAHEMVFGYAGATLAGFLLTAIPNWTGRLPLSGTPLLVLFCLWLAGRIAMLQPELFGLYPAALLDAALFPILALVAGREIVAGRNWKNLKILIVLVALSLVNVGYHAAALSGGDNHLTVRAGIAILVVLIGLVGGRMVPSFTRNWLVKQGAERLPHPFDWFDIVAMAALAAALAAWLLAPEGMATAILCALAAVLQGTRLVRWQGYATAREPLLLVLHLAYGFIPVGVAALGAAALGWVSETAALHLLTVGGIGLMTLSVMTRATRGHTGRPLSASPTTTIAFATLLAAALLRPLAELVPGAYEPLLALGATAWIAAYTLFIWEYAPMLLAARQNT